jgi:hypothetical protein
LACARVQQVRLTQLSDGRLEVGFAHFPYTW